MGASPQTAASEKAGTSTVMQDIPFGHAVRGKVVHMKRLLNRSLFVCRGTTPRAKCSEGNIFNLQIVVIERFRRDRLQLAARGAAEGVLAALQAGREAAGERLAALGLLRGLTEAAAA